jgi:hypothetical protein
MSGSILALRAIPHTFASDAGRLSARSSPPNTRARLKAEKNRRTWTDKRYGKRGRPAINNLIVLRTLAQRAQPDGLVDPTVNNINVVARETGLEVREVQNAVRDLAGVELLRVNERGLCLTVVQPRIPDYIERMNERTVIDCVPPRPAE